MLKLDIQMFAEDGKVIIGTELDTKSFEEQIKQTEAKLRRLEKAYEKASKKTGKFKPNNEAMARMREEIERTSNKLIELQAKQAKLNELPGGSSSGVLKWLKDAGKETEKNIKKIGRWVLAIFGVRSAYMAIRQAMSTITSQDEQLSADVTYMKNAIAYTLEPVIRSIVGLMGQLMSYVAFIINKFTGKNIFANANKSLKGATGSAKALNKELSKTTASFDEMNIVNDTSSGGGGGGGDTSLPSMDLSKIVDFSNFKPLEWLKEKLAEIREWIYSIDWQELGSNVYQSIKAFFTETDWAGIFESIFETIGAVFGGIGGFIVGFLRDAWKDISDYFGEWIEKSHEMGGSVVEGILMGILNAIYQIGKWIYDHIFIPFIDGFKKAFGIASPSKVMAEMGGYIIDGLKNGLIGIWNSVKSIFENLKTNMINIFISAWEGIKRVFSTVGSFFGNIVNVIYEKFRTIGTTVGNVVGGAFKGVINGVLNAIENILNSPIKAVNKLINTINDIPGINLNKLSTFKLPRLARGGIVNNPGPGVMMGNYVAGEQGPEAVLPLTEEVFDRLGEAIARHQNINATIPVYVGNRQIARELRKINAEDNFAFNN